MSSPEPPARALKVALFGAGARGVQCLAALGGDRRFEIACFFDNDPKKWNTDLQRLPVREPTAAACAEVDAIILASVSAKEVFAQLTRLGCAGKVALSPPHLARRFGGGVPVAAEDAADNGAEAQAGRRRHILDLAPAAVRQLAGRIDADPPAAGPASPAAAREVACTICGNNYLAYATVLARSFLRHHPGGRFFICLADRRRDEVAYPSDSRIGILESADLAIPGFENFAFKYGVLEFNTAVKPFLLERLLREEGVERLLYLDPDILVLAPLDDLFDELARTPLVLTPHLTEPYADDRQPCEIDILRAGTFNLGFVGVAAHAQTWRLLSWWQTRLYDGCTREVEKGYFVDQKWMDLVPSFFPEHRIIRHPGYNAAYWNLHERTIGFDGERFEVNGRALRFFHFSGIDIHDLDSVSKHQNRLTLPADGALRDLFELYRVLLVTHGHVELRGTPYAYGRFDNGVAVPDIVRTIYRDARLTSVYPDPFTTGGASSFYEWLRAPWRPESFISNLLATLHARTPELRAVYPTLGGEAEFGLLLHMSTAAELYGLPAEFVDDDPRRLNTQPEPASSSVTTLRMAPAHPSRPHRTRSVRRATRPDAPEPEPRLRVAIDTSVNTAPIFTSALRTAVELAVRGPHALVSADAGASERDTWGEPFVIGDVRLSSPDAAGQPPDVSYWLWDEGWACAPACEPALEIWVPSTYCLEGLSRIAAVPVVDMPLPVGVVSPSNAARDTLGLSDGRLLFVTVIDSVTKRGHDPLDTVRAFRAAFGAAGDLPLPALVLAATDAEIASEVQQRISPLAHGPAPIEVRQLATEDLVQLLRLSDCYVSLHGQVAFDVWMAHALWYGRPAVATHASGSTDVATVNNSFLVGSRRVGSGVRPDLEHAAALLRLAAESRSERRDRGARARRDVRATHSVEAVAARVVRRLQLLATRGPQRSSTATAGAA